MILRPVQCPFGACALLHMLSQNTVHCCSDFPFSDAVWLMLWTETLFWCLYDKVSCQCQGDFALTSVWRKTVEWCSSLAVWMSNRCLSKIKFHIKQCQITCWWHSTLCFKAVSPKNMLVIIFMLTVCFVPFMYLWHQRVLQPFQTLNQSYPYWLFPRESTQSVFSILLKMSKETLLLSQRRLIHYITLNIEHKAASHKDYMQ